MGVFLLLFSFFFFFNDTATTEIYTLSLHDALPISARAAVAAWDEQVKRNEPARRLVPLQDRKSTRLNSSHVRISYAVFCLKKKKRSKARDDMLFPEAKLDAFGPRIAGGVSFFFNDTATTEIYTLSLHDALPIARLVPL